MKKYTTAANLLAFLLLTVFSAKAQENINKKYGYTLVFKNNYSNFSPDLEKRLIKTFFEVYPVLAKEYNPKTPKEVVFVIDTAYKGVAATSDAKVVFNPIYMENHPEDIDVVTHEVMHIVQGYGYSSGPVWLTEGIADYVRNKFGVSNAGANWSMPDYKQGQSYENSYRITARFFTWIDKKVKSGTIKKIDQSLRAHTYKASLWSELTGKNLDELWADYAENPSLI
jgi:hypothetical protein